MEAWPTGREHREWLTERLTPAGRLASESLYRWSDVLTLVTEVPLTAANQQPRTDLLTVSELATALNVPTSTVHRWTSEKSIPFYKLGHRTVRYRLSEVLASCAQGAAVRRDDPHDRIQARSPLLGGLQVHRPDDGGEQAIPPFDWAEHYKKGG